MFISHLLSLPTSLVLLIAIETGAGFSTANYTNSTRSLNRHEPSRTTVVALPELSSSNLPPQPVTGLAAASHCWQQWNTYSHHSLNCRKTTIYGPLTTQIANITSTLYSTYKLCDGHPRVSATIGFRTSYSPYTIQYASATPSGGPSVTTFPFTLMPSGVALTTETSTLTVITRYPTPVCASPMARPRCEIDQNHVCQSLFGIWTSRGFPGPQPPCTYTQFGDCNGCQLYIPFAKLLYFPVEMTGDFCGENYRTVTPTPSSNLSTPTTLLWSGTTLTSGFAYLSYAGVTAGRCGTPKPAGLLPIPTSEVFSYRGHAAALPQLGDTQWPFNFADLSPNQVPWDAWIGQDTCFGHEHSADCQTVTQAAYRPWLVYPTQIWELDPRYKGCTSGAFGIFDPPTALPRLAVMATPTMSSSYATGEAGTGEATVRKSGMSPKTDGAAGGTYYSSKAASTDPARPGSPSTETGQSQGRYSVIQPSPADPKDPQHTTKSGDQPGSGTGEAPAPAPASSYQPPGHQSQADPNAHPNPTRIVPTSALSDLSIGTIPIKTATEPGVISVGTHRLTQGEQTTIGGTIVSLGSHSLVIAPIPEPTNGLSILSAAQTKDQPYVTIPVGRETLTVYSGGVVVGPHTTRGPDGSVMTVRGHTVTLGEQGVQMGSSTWRFRGSSETAAQSTTQGQKVEVTYIHGTASTTMEGHISGDGKTVVPDGSSLWTYSGQSIVAGGTTFSPRTSPTLGPLGSGASLPPIITASRGMGSITLPPIVTGARPSDSKATTTSSSAAADPRRASAVQIMAAFVFTCLIYLL